MLMYNKSEFVKDLTAAITVVVLGFLVWVIYHTYIGLIIGGAIAVWVMVAGFIKDQRDYRASLKGIPIVDPDAD